jgi:nucleoside transporter
VLFFLHGMAMGAWFVPLGPVLDAHHLHSIKPFAFATSAIAALISPLIFGAIADRHLAPSRVLSALALTTALTMSLIVFTLRATAPPWLVLAVIQLQALCLAPTWGLGNSIVLAEITDSRKQFGPIRAIATVGWMAGCWLVSAFNADTSSNACVISAAVWFLVAFYALMLPARRPPPSAQHLTISERLGLDALVLLRDPNHRVVLLTVAFFAVPLAAFYPFTPTHLRDLGLEHTSAWMSMGQITEVIAMLALPFLLHRFSFKAVLSIGIAVGLLRYVLCALDGKAWVLTGVTLHGFAFTLFFITVQIYLDQRIDPTWRTRAQALYSVMLSGVGNFAGYLGAGLWLSHVTQGQQTDWRVFWGGLAIAIAPVFIYFTIAYRRKKL